MNPHSFNLMRENGALLSDIQKMDRVFVDGIGVVLAAFWCGLPRIERISFDMLAPVLLQKAAAGGIRVALVGGAPGIAEAARDVVVSDYPGLEVVLVHHGYLKRDSDYTEVGTQVASTGTQLLILGMGAPLQEHAVHQFGRYMDGGAILTCGGYLDQVCRPKAYYPSWAYPLRLNWVVRLAREPRRLWRRYLIGNPRFIVDTIAWRVRRTSGQ